MNSLLRTANLASIAILGVALAGCSLARHKSTPREPGTQVPSGSNVPKVPPDVLAVPDAVPKHEPRGTRGNPPFYTVFGKRYHVMAASEGWVERGTASWYGPGFHAASTSLGEPYDMYAMTAAHKTLPIPSYARVRNPANGREVIVRVNDRGPFHAGRIVDLSYTAALKLGVLGAVAPVELERITFEDIRTGAWRRDGLAVAAAPAPAPATPPAPSPTSPGSEVPPAAPPVAVGGGSIPVAGAPADAAPAAEPVTPVDAAPARASAMPVRGFWIQLGAFRQLDGAEAFQRRVATELDWLAPLLAVFSDAPIYRLQAGPYPNREAARAGADRIRDALQLVPVVIERR
jgi:rare lipoprotein A